MPTITISRFPLYLTSKWNDDSLTNEIDYRSSLEKYIRGDWRSDSVFDQAIREYGLLSAPIEMDPLARGIAGKIMLPAKASAEVMSAFATCGSMLSEVNCPAPSNSTVLSDDDCYTYCSWGGERLESDLYLKRHTLRSGFLRTRINRTVLINSLKNGSYAELSESLVQGGTKKRLKDQLNDVLLNILLSSTWLDATESDGARSYSDSIRALEVEGRELHTSDFWNECCLSNERTLTGSGLWIMDASTLEDILPVEDRNGRRLIQYDSRRREYRLLNSRVLKLDRGCIPYHEYADAGEMIALYVDLGGLTLSFQQGMPIYLEPHGNGSGSRPCETLKIPYASCITAPQGWLALKKV